MTNIGEVYLGVISGNKVTATEGSGRNKVHEILNLSIPRKVRI